MEAIFLESLFVEQIGAVVDRTIPRPPPPAVVVLRYFYNAYNIFRISLQCGVRATPAEFHFKATGAVVLPRQKILHLTFNITLHCLSYVLSIFINSALQCSLEKAYDISNIIFRITECPNCNKVIIDGCGKLKRQPTLTSLINGHAHPWDV